MKTQLQQNQPAPSKTAVTQQPKALDISSVCAVPVCLLSDVDAAKFLGISRSLIREYADKGKLKAVKLPHPSGVGFVNRTLFDVDDLKRFVSKAKGESDRD